MSGAVRSIGNAVHNIGGGITSAVNQARVGGENLSQVLGDAKKTIFGSDAPHAPGMSPGLQQTLANQQAYAKSFRGDLPQITNTMQGRMAQQANQGLQNNLRQTRTSNASRGLLYGGVNAGQEGQQRASAQRGLISADSALNTGLQNEANSLDQAAMQTGVGIQQQQQAMQNSVYQNAMAQMAGQNQIAGSALSAATMALMLA